MQHKTKKYSLVARPAAHDSCGYFSYTVRIYCNQTAKLLDCNDYFVPMGEYHECVFKQALSCYKLRQRINKKKGA